MSYSPRGSRDSDTLPDYDSFVVVHRTSDPIEAEIIGEILQEETIKARVIGTRNAALIGVAPHVVEQFVEVPFLQAERAAGIVDTFFRERQAIAAQQDDEDDEEARVPPHKNVLIAGLVPFVPLTFAALGPMYLGFLWCGFLLTLAEGLSGMAMVRGHGAFAAAFVLMKLGESYRSVTGARAFNRGQPRSGRTELLGTVALISASLLAGTGLTMLGLTRDAGPRPVLRRAH